MESILSVIGGNRVTMYWHNGRPCVLAREFGVAIGYTPDGFNKVLRDWIRAEALEPGNDFAKLGGRALSELLANPAEYLDELEKDFKTFTAPTDATHGGARSAVVLYESGWDAVALKTEKPIGVKLRKYLRDEVLPRLRRKQSAVAANDRIALYLADTPNELRRMWEERLTTTLCQLYRIERRNQFPIGLCRPIGNLYNKIWGKAVADEARARTDRNKGERLYNQLSKSALTMMAAELSFVESLAYQSATVEEFWARVASRYEGAPFQLRLAVL